MITYIVHFADNRKISKKVTAKTRDEAIQKVIKTEGYGFRLLKCRERN